jgi:hypothetical protein
MRRCLQGLDPVEDTEDCGYADQVDACFGEGVFDPEGATPDAFIEDLERAIRDWYHEHQDEVRARGGRSLDSALDRLDPDRVGQVSSEEDDENWEYDPQYYQIFYHVDPVFRDSARIWFGAYEPSGRLEALWAVN